jgi:hypothetical protein
MATIGKGIGGALPGTVAAAILRHLNQQSGNMTQNLLFFKVIRLPEQAELQGVRALTGQNSLALASEKPPDLIKNRHNCHKRPLYPADIYTELE